MSRPRVLVVSLGGTIAMTGPAGEGVTPRLDAGELTGAIPGLADRAEISAQSFRLVPSAHLSIADLVELARVGAGATENGFAGVVITQGTDTIEETAFALDLLLATPAPVVVTGAMRNPAQPGADGPANLLDAVTVAASARARGLGVLVVLAGELHAARHVQKTHTVSVHAFRSATGPLGWVAEGVPQLLARPAHPPRAPLVPRLEGGTPSVALLTAALGDDGRLVSAVADLGYDGAVVEALGAGHVPPGMVAPLERLADRVPVVLCSRTGRGPVLSRTYAFPGSETDLLGRGLISGGYLDGPKARIALTLCLAAGGGDKEIRRLFTDQFGALG